MTSTVEPISRRTFDTGRLVAEFPPRFINWNKRIVLAISCPPESIHSGVIEFTRWPAMSLPASVGDETPDTVYEAREAFFDYVPVPLGTGDVEWYLNFAHTDLFCAYGGPLFAQDEMQVAEHPALGSLREALLASDILPRTTQAGRPTPVLIKGVERRCRIATDCDPGRGRPDGLYGNRFSRASDETVRSATEAIVPPTISNILAMEAPPGGDGAYARATIEWVLTTAFTGFSATCLESERGVQPSAGVKTVVHTGFWGCGAYGGNRLLMALLQIMAARMAGLDRLVFHSGGKDGTQVFLEALRAWRTRVEAAERPIAVVEIVDWIESLELCWGTSDGN